MKFKERLAYFALEGSQTLVMFRKTLWVASVLFIGCANLGRMVSDPNQSYDFRKTRWGFTQEMVRLAEQGKRMHLKSGNVVIFNHSLVSRTVIDRLLGNFDVPVNGGKYLFFCNDGSKGGQRSMLAVGGQLPADPLTTWVSSVCHRILLKGRVSPMGEL